MTLPVRGSRAAPDLAHGAALPAADGEVIAAPRGALRPSVRGQRRPGCRGSCAEVASAPPSGPVRQRRPRAGGLRSDQARRARKRLGFRPRGYDSFASECGLVSSWPPQRALPRRGGIGPVPFHVGGKGVHFSYTRLLSVIQASPLRNPALLFAPGSGIGLTTAVTGILAPPSVEPIPSATADQRILSATSTNQVVTI